MTDEQINQTIAEAIGWRISESLTGWQHKTEDGAPPDYLNDLNAMHEAEMSLPVEKFNGQEWDRSRSEYRWRLRLICLHPCHATARERAEAFLQTIGKWEEQS